MLYSDLVVTIDVQSCIIYIYGFEYIFFSNNKRKKKGKKEKFSLLVPPCFQIQMACQKGG